MKQMAQKKKVIQITSKTLPKASTGIQGLDEITGGRVATRPSPSSQWRRRFRKDTVRIGVPGSGCYAIRRSRRVHIVRGIDPGPDQECRFAGVRPGRVGSRKETVRGPRVHHTKRVWGNWRV